MRSPSWSQKNGAVVPVKIAEAAIAHQAAGQSLLAEALSPASTADEVIH
jgi:hypothetical protein